MTGWVPEVNYLPTPLSNKTTWPLHKGVSIELSETPLNASSGQSIWPPMMFQQVFFQDCKRPLELTIPFKTVHHPEFQEAFQWADASAHKKRKGHICISGGETLHNCVGTAHHTWHNGYTATVLRSPVARAGETWLDFLLHGLDSSSLKTSLRSEWLPGEQARLNSNSAERVEMWEGGILQDNQGQGSTQHKQCFETHLQRILQLSLSAEGVGRYQNCS